MAGAVTPGSSKYAPPGYVWDAQAGGYVPANRINPNTRQTYGTGQQAALDASMGKAPQPTVNGLLPGPVGSSSSGVGTWPPGGSGSGGGGGISGSPGSGAAATPANPWQNEIQSLISELRQPQPSTPSTITPVTGGGEGGGPYDMAAERATYGRAKERTALATQAALRSMREQMAARGISGSGIEAEAMGNVYTAGLGELADTDRTLAEGQAGRAFAAEQSNIDRLIQQMQFNANTQNTGSSNSAQERLARLGLMAQLMKLY